MALLDLFTTKVRTLEDWSPDVPRSRIDMDALVADMRQSGVAALDRFLDDCLDRDRAHHTLDYRQPDRIVSELSETDRLRLLARATQTSAVVTYLHLTWPETIQAAKALIWTGMLNHAVSSIERTRAQLDDRTAAALARAARISSLVPTTGSGRIDLLEVAKVLVGCTPEPMSDAQRRSLADVTDLIDGFSWEPLRYESAVNAVEALCRRFGRPFSESALFARRERAKDTARLAVAYICAETSPPLKALIEALCQRCQDSKTKDVQDSLAAEISAFPPPAKGEALGMMAEAHRRKEALEAGKAPKFPSYWEYQMHTLICHVSCNGSGPFSDLVGQLLKTKVVASDAAAAALLTVMPTARVLQDLRVINIALATMKAETAPQTRQAASACVTWIEKNDWPRAAGKSFAAQAVHRLKAALENNAAAAGAEIAAEEPLPPRPVLKGWGDAVAFEKALITYYGDPDDLRKCTLEDVAFVEDYLKGPRRPDKSRKITEATILEEFDEEWAIRLWHTSTRQHFPAALLDRMRKGTKVPVEFHAAWKALHLRACELEGKSAPSDKWLKGARPALAYLSSEQRVAFLTTVLDILTPG
jgi:hypothetical protein